MVKFRGSCGSSNEDADAARALRRQRDLFRGAVASKIVFALAVGASTASAQGLDRARTVLETFQTELTTIVPVAAALVLLVLGIAYAGNFIEKDTFARWGIGVIIAGSAVQITAMLFGS